ncbi:MAG TPA: hypothetical protein VNR64_09830 [Vicinamibacterales bacterium]|nr:hypothetical protein [Vicinamibacterales bacterium]
MNRRTWGILAAIAGSAFGAWYVRSRFGRRAGFVPGGDRGTVIFDNTPVASDVDAIV